MKAKPILLLVVALGCGLVAMLGVQQVMSGPTEIEEPETNEMKVLVATQDIEPFAALDDSNSKLVKVPAEAVQNPDGVVRSREQVVDKRLKHGASEGEYIFLSKLVDKNYAPSTEIPKGKRVVTVKVNQTKSHSGLLRPGDHVDVVLTYKSYSRGRQPVQRTVTVLQNVEVFATDNQRVTTVRDAQGNEISVKNTSLLVSPSDANLLMLAESRGQLTLSLRSSDDKDKATSEAFTDQVFDNITDGVFSKKDSEADKEVDIEQLKQKWLAELQNRQKKDNRAEDSQNSGEVKMIRPKWKMTIYEGSKSSRVEEVEDPNAPLVRVRVPDDQKSQNKAGRTFRRETPSTDKEPTGPKEQPTNPGNPKQDDSQPSRTTAALGA